jgi:hypothetical protein
MSMISPPGYSKGHVGESSLGIRGSPELG